MSKTTRSPLPGPATDSARSGATEIPTKVRVLYFAGLRDQVGQDEQDLLLPSPSLRVEEVLRLIEEEHPRLTLAAVRVAVNEEFADARAPVTGGDVVALIPPVSGG